MTARLAGRRALVTGAGNGLGRAVAVALAAEGAAVAVNDRDAGAASAVAGEICAAGGNAIAYAASVTDTAAARQMVADVADGLGGLDALVNSAGIASSGKRVEETSLDEVQRLLNVHTLAPYVLSQAALPWLRAAGHSDIVVMSSIATDTYGPNAAPYNMAKAAAEAFAFTLAKEELRNGIRVNVIAPGAFDTALGREIADRLTAARRRRGMGGPSLHLSDPVHVGASVVTLLLSDECLAGERIRVTG